MTFPDHVAVAVITTHVRAFIRERFQLRHVTIAELLDHASFSTFTRDNQTVLLALVHTASVAPPRLHRYNDNPSSNAATILPPAAPVTVAFAAVGDLLPPTADGPLPSLAGGRGPPTGAETTLGT